MPNSPPRTGDTCNLDRVPPGASGTGVLELAQAQKQQRRRGEKKRWARPATWSGVPGGCACDLRSGLHVTRPSGRDRRHNCDAQGTGGRYVIAPCPYETMKRSRFLVLRQLFWAPTKCGVLACRSEAFFVGFFPISLFLRLPIGVTRPDVAATDDKKYPSMTQ